MSDTVLLTGATGFLGMELLARLLERTDSEILALVRAADRESARRRLAGVLGRLFDDPPELCERITAIPADLAQDGLGLAASDRGEILSRATSVIHCAASIAFDLPLEEAQNINVGGTSRMLTLASELAESGRLRRMLHVSTAYVCGRHKGIFREGDLDVEQSYRNTYEQSKAQAERVLRLNAHGLPLAVVRPSIVVGDSRCGWTPSFNVIYWPLQAFARNLLHRVPIDPHGILDIVPVDYVADGILAVHEADEIEQTTHLVAGRQATTNRAFVELACAYFDRPLPALSAHDDRATAGEHGPYAGYLAVEATFDDRRARELLDPRGIACPPLERYFSTLLDYAERARWGKRTFTRESVRSPIPSAAG